MVALLKTRTSDGTKRLEANNLRMQQAKRALFQWPRAHSKCLDLERNIKNVFLFLNIAVRSI